MKTKKTQPLQAGGFMSKPVATVQADATIQEAARIMTARHISGLVVLDAAGEAIGILSASDIVTFETTRHEHVVCEEEHERLSRSAQRRIREGFQLEHADDHLVKDVMTPGIVTTTPEASAFHIAQIMSRKRIHRVCIQKGGKIVGIVTALDIARVLGDPD